MSKTVFITGTNSGIGHATVELFAKEGWNVAASVRNIGRHPDLFKAYNNVKLYEMELTDFEQVQRVAQSIVNDLGKVDVLINNAGYCLIGPTETSSMEQIKAQYETNVFGTFAVIKSFIPHMRQNGSGSIINIASSSAQFNYPFVAAYGSSKWAVRGITESLGIELAPFNISVKAIYPGTHATKIFTKLDHGASPDDPGYQPYKSLYRNFFTAQRAFPKGTDPSNVAKKIFSAANSNGGKLHIIAGGDAKFLILMKKILTQQAFQKMQIGTITKPITNIQKMFVKWMFGNNVKEVQVEVPQTLFH